MKYEDAIEKICNAKRFGHACGRDVTVEFLDKLGHPEDGMKVIHIAGTNGKGSVSAFVTRILMEGTPYKIGTFTSPHLINFTERIKVNDVEISKEDVSRLTEQLLSVELTQEPTMFDYCLAMALLYFREQGVQYVVLETGLGGRKDSTRGLSTTPLVSAITSIGLEHTAILGNTLEQIAYEKAGIIREGTKVVIGEMDPKASRVIVETCNELNSEYYFSKEVSSDTKLGLFGAYQRKNAGVAVEIVKHLDIEISEENILKGLMNARWLGRMQIVSFKPFIMLDGAHNPSGIQALYDSLKEACPNESFTFVMAVMADKNYLEMANILRGIAKRFYTCSIDYHRALQASKLCEELKGIELDAIYFENYNDAIEEAKKHNEKIIVCGSLYFIGEVLKDIQHSRQIAPDFSRGVECLLKE